VEFDHATMEEFFVRAAKQVYSDLLDIKIELKEAIPINNDDNPEKSHPPTYGVYDDIFGVRIDFSGDFEGEMFLYFNRPLAEKITKTFFDKNEVEIDQLEDDSVDEIIQEMANMTSGLFKSGFLKNNLDCLLGLPRIMHNECVAIEDPNTIRVRLICNMTVLDDVMMADLVIYQ
jgi:CheY-specific phosphatase CheX